MAQAPQPAASSPYTYDTNEPQRELYEKTLSKVKRLRELDLPQHIPQYTEASVEEALYPLIDEHQVLIVAGAFFGDEGKGKTVDAIANHPRCTCVARTNSGENAGHTVFHGGKKYVFHLAPSGLLVPGKRNFVGPECVMDPISFQQREVKQLVNDKVDYHERLFVGNVHIVTPYHKLLDMITSPLNASTLKGMSPIHSSKVMKRGLRLDHIFNDVAVMRRRLTRDMDAYFGACKTRNMEESDVLKMCQAYNADGVERIPSHVMAFVTATDKVEYLIDLYIKHVRDNPAFPQRCDVAHELRLALDNGHKVLLEGPQSFWLSNAREKYWEGSTSADTSASGVLATAQFNFQRYKTLVINVHKAPASSRVGIGANPSGYVPQDFFSAQGVNTLRDLPSQMCVDFDAIQRTYCRAIRENGIVEPVQYTDSTGTYHVGVAMSIASSRHHGESGATTLKPRICGLFDCVSHFEVNAVQGPYLTISAVDRGDDYETLAIAVAYIYHSAEGKEVSCNGRKYRNGDIIRAGDPVPSEAALQYCHPIVKQIPGWSATPIAATKRPKGAPLPPGVCEFIASVEHFTKAKVLSIGNGPTGHDIIYLKQTRG